MGWLKRERSLANVHSAGSRVPSKHKKGRILIVLYQVPQSDPLMNVLHAPRRAHRHCLLAFHSIEVSEVSIQIVAVLRKIYVNRFFDGMGIGVGVWCAATVRRALRLEPARIIAGGADFTTPAAPWQGGGVGDGR